jgi:hypothetical protein
MKLKLASKTCMQTIIRGELMEDRIGREVRRARRERDLGENPACVLCCYSNPYSLMRVKRSLLEDHHIFPKANDPDATMILCRNCHGEITEANRDAGISMRKANSLTEKVITFLSCLKVLFLTLANACGRMVQELTESLKRENQNGAQPI